MSAMQAVTMPESYCAQALRGVPGSPSFAFRSSVRAERGVEPGWIVVEEVPVLEREGERRRRRDALAVHADAALPARSSHAISVRCASGSRTNDCTTL